MKDERLYAFSNPLPSDTLLSPKNVFMIKPLLTLVPLIMRTFAGKMT